MKKFTLGFVVLLMMLCPVSRLIAQQFIYDDAWEKAGFTLTEQRADAISVDFSITGFEIVGQEIDGKQVKNILMQGAVLPNNEGAPDLPGFGRYVAIPEGAAVRLEVTGYRKELIRDVDMAPAPRIPKDNERGALEYHFNEKIYGRDAFYPAEPFRLSPVTEIRGVDAVMLGITPFQYNPVTRELIVYRDVRVELKIDGGNGTYGESRLRSRWFDPILEDALLNFSALPKIDYNQRQKSTRSTNGYEYLIVIPNDPAWMPYAEQIRDFRVKQGINTGIVTLNDIGGTSASALENYFDNAYNTWDPAPVAVLLMADYGTNASNSIIAPIWDNYCASDNIFADVNNNDMPDIIFARMTAQNTSHLQTMVSKMLNYENDPPTDAGFYNKPITALGWQTERWFQICSEVVGGFWREVQGKDPVRINAIYDGTPGSTWSTATNTSTVVGYFGPSGLGYIPSSPSQLGGWSGGTAAQVVNAINNGAFALQHRDHGYEQGWGEPAFNSTNINSLTNTQDNKLVFVFSINCLTGKYNMSGECFTEKFHRYTYNGQNAGALGLIAASEVSYSFVNDTYVWGMLDNMEPGFMPDYGMPVDERGFLPAFGNAAGKYFLQQSNWPYNSNSKEVTYNLFHMHGGAFMTVYTEVPQNLTVNHNPVLLSGETGFSVSADAGSFVALTVNGDIIGTAEGTGSPVNIAIPSQEPATEMVVTVTKQNFYRYESTVPVVPPSGPYVVFDHAEVNDNGGNGQLDYGESVSLHVTLKNVGTETATNVDAQVSSSDAYVTLTNNQAVFGDIPAGGTVTVDDAFALDVSGDLPDGHIVNFTLESSDGSDQWTSYFAIAGHAPLLEVQGYFVDDASGNQNGILDPGETAPVTVTVLNSGGAAADNVTGVLTTADPYLEIHTTSAQTFGNLGPTQAQTATFTVEALASTPAGYLAEALLELSADLGIAQQATLKFNFADYCYPSADCSYGDGFTGFALEEINNMSSGCSGGGYGDFTSMTANLEAGQTYTVSWKTGYSNQDASLWIDLNSNRIFEESERLITDFNLASVGTVYTTSFTLPENIYPGNKRLRIRANWQNSSADPCASFSYGETEDYNVNITSAAVVAAFSADPTLICEGSTVNFTDQSTGDVMAWEWSFPGGEPSTSTEQNPVVNYPTPGIYDVTLTVYGSANSDTKQRSAYIQVNQNPVQPPQPQGMIQLCFNPGNTYYSFGAVSGISTYQWNLSPSDAGVITGTSTYATVNWNNTFAGEAVITVQAVGECGAGPASEPLIVTITGLPEDAGTISGNPGACVGGETAITVADIPGADNYTWEVDPEGAATLEMDGTSCVAHWEMYYEGQATVHVRGENSCGTGAWSPPFVAEVVNCSAGGLPPGWEHNPTPVQHTILIPNDANLSVFGNPFLQGDYIGVFYVDENGNEKCGGAIEWSLAENTTVMAFGDDISTPEKDGFDQGEEMRWRVYCWNTETEYPLFPDYNPLMPQHSGTFINMGVSGVLALQAYQMADIFLNQGWSGFSMPVTPFEQDLPALFDPVADELVILQNSRSIWWPAMNINTFEGWDCHVGAAVKMNAGALFMAVGIPSLDKTVNLPAGWSYLPVLSDCDVSAAAVLGPLAGSVEVVKEIAGYDVYWPAMNVYTLETLHTGKSYFIKLANQASVTFPECADAGFEEPATKQQVPAAWNVPVPVPGSHLLFINPGLIEGLEMGDYIGAFSASGKTAGVIRTMGQPVVLNVFGDDPSTVGIEGFTSGEMMTFRLFRPDTGEEFPLEFSFDLQSPDWNGRFVQNGISAVIEGSAATTGIASYTDHVMVYPNPASGKITVYGLTNFDHLEVMTAKGQRVVKRDFSGIDRLTLDMSDNPAGIYLLRLNGLKMNKMIRVILR